MVKEKLEQKYYSSSVSTEIFQNFQVAAWYMLKEDKKFLLLAHSLDYYIREVATK